MQQGRDEMIAGWTAFRDMICEKTKGKLIMLRPSEVATLLVDTEAQFQFPIGSFDEMALLRRKIRHCLQAYQLEASRLLHFLVAVNEAVTNALLYGKQVQSELYVVKDKTACRVIVSDQGSGFTMSEVVKAVFVRGYSTRESLGVGFQVMLHYADRIWMCTSRSGTLLLLELSLGQNGAKEERADNRFTIVRNGVTNP